MSTINPEYELPLENTVEVECELLDVSGEIRSPTITQIDQNIDAHVNDHSVHRNNFATTFATDGVSNSYTIIHSLNSNDLQITFYDVTAIPQQLFFVHWEPVSSNAIKIVPDVTLPANRAIKVLIQ
jgi:hypothetical protein